MKIRVLNAEEIDVRIQSVVEGKSIGAILILYKNARVDMQILDEIFGITGWKRKHDVVNNNLFCTISIWDEDKKQWIDKQDVGVESNQSSEKGEASDSFKRAAVNIGIGRELYTPLFIWVNLNENEYTSYNGKPKAKSSLKFSVKEIGYNEAREINRLTIVDNYGKERFALGKAPTAPTAPTKKTEPANLICSDCGENITAKGKTTATQISNGTKEKYGLSLCSDCALKRKAQQEIKKAAEGFKQ